MILRLAAVLAALAVSDAAIAETPTRGIAEIDTGESTVTLQVEIADEPGEHARGLMYRSALAPRAGMLFLYERPRHAAFWMKNTIIPLDMVFIDPAGRIVKIAERTEPHSLEPIPSDVPVAAVLEIGGGAADELGLSLGDRVDWIEFPPRD